MKCEHEPSGVYCGHYNCWKCGELLGFDGYFWENKPKGTIWKWNDEATEMVFVMNV